VVSFSKGTQVQTINSNTPLPEDTRIKKGVLENGMTYIYAVLTILKKSNACCVRTLNAAVKIYFNSCIQYKFLL